MRQFTVSPELVHYNISLKSFLEQRPGTQGLSMRALIFRTFGGITKILLIQRAASDSSPNRWEIPGGGADPEDETMLHALVRELFEETGLEATSIGKQVSDGRQFVTARRKLNVHELCFDVSVAETSLSQDQDQEQEQEQETGTSAVLSVNLDPKEHQSYAWASAEQVERQEIDGVRIQLTSAEIRDVILEGFRMRSEQRS